MNNTKKLKKSSFAEGTLIATFAIIFTKIIGLLYVIPFTNMVGQSGRALYGYAYTIYAIFLDISSAGLPIAISKLIKEYDTLGKIEAKERAYKLGRNIIFILALISFLIMFIFANQIATSLLKDISNEDGVNTIKDVALAIRCVSLSILIVPSLSVTKGYLQGHNIIGVSSFSQVLEQIVRITIILAGSYITLNIFGYNITTAVCISVMGAFFGAIIALIYTKIKIHNFKKNEEPKELIKNEDISNKEIIKKIFSYAIPFIIIDTMFSIYSYVDMFIVIRALHYIGFDGSSIQTISTNISTWAPKITVIIASMAMGMSTSLIPTIVSAYTLKNYKEVNNKLNQALQMILTISLPMALGIALLSKPIWTIFYGNSDSYGAIILSIAAFVAVMGNLFMITSSTLQSLNKFKLVYKSSLYGLLINIILDIVLILGFNKTIIPAYLGAPIASIIGYGFSSLYTLYNLKKEHSLKYNDTFKLIKKLLLPLILMTIIVFTINYLLPFNQNTIILCLIRTIICAVIGALVYGIILIKNGTLKEVLGESLYKRIITKLTFGKIK